MKQNKSYYKKEYFERKSALDALISSTAILACQKILFSSNIFRNYKILARNLLVWKNLGA